MGRGRRAKPGKRTESGRLKRNNYPAPAYDHGTERAQAKRKRFGTYGSSAIGRAYASGLLGDEQQARTRYDAGKRFQSAVERFFNVGRVKCPIGQEMRLGATIIQISGNPFEDEEWLWLIAKADALDERGLRPWLDQITLDLYADHGPSWLDRLVNGGKDPADKMVLKAALDALDLIAPESKQLGIRVVRD